jgi:hypothetical protein
MKGTLRRSSLPPLSLQTIAFIAISNILTFPLAADWRDDIGFTRLQLLAGAETPTASSAGLTMVEPPLDDPPTLFVPDTANPLFTGKTFNILSSPSGTSSHATFVAFNYFGNTTSILPGAFEVDCYEANGWINADFLKLSSSAPPLVESRAVQNHSWIAEAGEISAAAAEEVNQRLDFAIDRDGFSCAVGVNNGTTSTTTLPYLLGQSYHTISVGLTNGNHSAGFTTLDGTGRIKPDIVGPENFTSFATPMVAGTAALLHEKLSQSPHSLTGADLPRVTKALLLATATKDNVPSWSNTTTRPLDIRYGAGQLNAHHAWQAMRGGNLPASGVTVHPSRGWAAESVPATGTRTWFFTVPTGAIPTPFCAALTWHRVVDDGPGPGWGNLQVSLADLNLRLHNASGFTLGSLITESTSTVDNVELVHQAALPAGTYALVVENTSGDATQAALAWHSLPAVTVAATTPTAREIDGAPGLVTFTRTGDTSLPLLVPLTTGGTAVSGSHFVALPASVTIPAGSSTTTLTIAPISDALAQGDRTLTVAVAADFALVRDPAQNAVITLEDKPFDEWRFANFDTSELANPAISSEAADPDYDALPNLVEYALALAPETFDLNPITVAPAAGVLQLTATKNPAATDITWAAEVCDDLITWLPANIDTNTSTNFAASDTVPIAGAEKRFMRLKVTR